MIVESGAPGRYRVTNLDPEAGEVVTDVIDADSRPDAMGCCWYRHLKRDADGNLVYNSRGEIRRVRRFVDAAIVIEDLGLPEEPAVEEPAPPDPL